MLPKWAWSGSREQFLHCGLRKFRHSKSSVDGWYTQLNVVGLFMTLETMAADSIASWLSAHLSVTHCLRLNLQLHTINLVRTCRISSFCTVAWQLARFQLTRRIARSLGDSWVYGLSLHLFSLTFRNFFWPSYGRGGAIGPIAPCGCATGTMSNVDAGRRPEHDRRLQVTKLPHDSTGLVKTFTRRKQTDLQFSKMPINFERKNCH